MAASGNLPDLGDSIDHATFEQIIEMDDDDDEFSRGIVFGFFEQAESTFAKMDERIKQKNLDELSSLGHFLKGSSAIIGLNKIKQSCEKIQHLGQSKDETGLKDENPDTCLELIKDELSKMREEYSHVEQGLRRFYGAV